MNIKTNKLSMALAWALARVDQLAISQPPDLEHVGKSRRTGAMKRLRQAWAGYGWGRARRSAFDLRSPAEHQSRIAAAQAKRVRRQIRNLALLNRLP